MQLYYEASMHPNLDNEEKWLKLRLSNVGFCCSLGLCRTVHPRIQTVLSVHGIVPMPGH